MLRAGLDTGYAGDRRSVVPRFTQQAGLGRTGIEPALNERVGYLSLPLTSNVPPGPHDSLFLAPLINVSIHVAAALKH